jgi:hypothetical protein
MRPSIALALSSLLGASAARAQTYPTAFFPASDVEEFLASAIAGDVVGVGRHLARYCPTSAGAAASAVAYFVDGAEEGHVPACDRLEALLANSSSNDKSLKRAVRVSLSWQPFELTVKADGCSARTSSDCATIGKSPHTYSTKDVRAELRKQSVSGSVGMRFLRDGALLALLQESDAPAFARTAAPSFAIANRARAIVRLPLDWVQAKLLADPIELKLEDAGATLVATGAKLEADSAGAPRLTAGVGPAGKPVAFHLSATLGGASLALKSVAIQPVQAACKTADPACESANRGRATIAKILEAGLRQWVGQPLRPRYDRDPIRLKWSGKQASLAGVTNDAAADAKSVALSISWFISRGEP